MPSMIICSPCGCCHLPLAPLPDDPDVTVPVVRFVWCGEATPQFQYVRVRADKLLAATGAVPLAADEEEKLIRQVEAVFQRGDTALAAVTSARAVLNLIDQLTPRA